MQRPDSDVDTIVGFSPEADFNVDVCGSIPLFMEQLPETLGIEVDVIAFTEQGFMRYVDMEALLSGKTIWDDVSWPEASRNVAIDILQKGYTRLKKACKMMYHIQDALLAIEVLVIKVKL